MESPPELPVASYFSELSSKLEELKQVYQINSTLMKQRDEEIENLKHQVSIVTAQLTTAHSLLETFSSQLEGTTAELVLSKDECSSLRAELEESDESLKKETSAKLQVEENLHLKEIELKYANEAVQEKTEEISELMCLLLEPSKYSEVDSNSSGDETEIYENKESNSKLTLSPIPEENIDEIPDYYDECKAYVSSLRITIGTEVDSGCDSLVEDPSRQRKKRKAQGSSKFVNVKKTSATESKTGSESSDSSVKRCKKKRKRFSVLFEVAHY